MSSSHIQNALKDLFKNNCTIFVIKCSLLNLVSKYKKLSKISMFLFLYALFKFIVIFKYIGNFKFLFFKSLKKREKENKNYNLKN